MNIIIKQAQIEELDTILEMRMEVLADVFKQDYKKMTSKEWIQLREENRRYYMRELPSGGHVACFAYIDNKIIGCGGVCLYSEMPSPDNRNGKCAYLMNVYVRPAYRGLGIGKKIVEWLINVSKQEGAGKIYLESSNSAKVMYKEIGFCDMKDYMKL